ncbi:MAG: DUF3822 family protein [Chitinophagales bacterium]
MIAVLPSYQKIETGKLPEVASTEGFILNVEVGVHQIAAVVEVAAFKQFLYLLEFNFSKPLQVAQLPEVCKQLLADNAVFALAFSEVNVAFNTDIDLLPNGFQQHTGSCFLQQVSEEVLAAFTVENVLQEVWKEKFPLAQITAVYANFLKQVLLLPKGVYVMVMHEAFAVAVLEAPGKLQLFNCFEYKTAEDFLYFLMLVCDSTQVNRTETPLVFSGKIQKESKIYDVCYRYFSNIVFLKPGNGKFFAKAFSDAAKSIYFSLFSL